MHITAKITFIQVLGIWAIVVVMTQKSSMSIFEFTTDKYPCKSFNQKYFLGKTAFEKISLSLSIYRNIPGHVLSYDYDHNILKLKLR